jgi:hypothetical protein
VDREVGRRGEHDVEPVKGGLSNAMKRAAVHYGIGRYLYDVEESFARVHDGGKYSAKTKDGTWFKWDPPELPPKHLPARGQAQRETRQAAAAAERTPAPNAPPAAPKPAAAPAAAPAPRRNPAEVARAAEQQAAALRDEPDPRDWTNWLQLFGAAEDDRLGAVARRALRSVAENAPGLTEQQRAAALDALLDGKATDKQIARLLGRAAAVATAAAQAGEPDYVPPAAGAPNAAADEPPLSGVMPGRTQDGVAEVAFVLDADERPVPAECPTCGHHHLWDNRAENDQRVQDGQKRRPDFVCKQDRAHVVWHLSEKDLPGAEPPASKRTAAKVPAKAPAKAAAKAAASKRGARR